MIAKIGANRGSDPGGLVNYLFGPGKANEHVNQRTIAGTVHYPGASGAVTAQVAADLRMPQQMWPAVTFPGGHVWHCSLALGASEGALSERKWAAIADDFMHEMKLTDPKLAPVRWSAVHHGSSAAGNDHIHLVVNLVREDGSKVNIWQDMVRSQQVVQGLEAKYGLQRLQSRTAAAGAGNIPYSQAEMARARKTQMPIERVELERQVRGLAAASVDESEFVRRLRESGMTVRPYPPSGPVTGYSVGLPPPPGELPIFFQGGELARDLTLPRLRLAWGQPAEAAASARLEWRRGEPGRPVSQSAREVRGIPATPDALARALDDLTQLAQDLDSAPPEQFAALSADVAGTIAAAAPVAPPAEQPALQQAAREVAAWAGTRAPAPAIQRRGSTASLIFLQALNPRSEWAQAFMLRQLLDMVTELHRLHRAKRLVATTPSGGMARMNAQPDDVDGVFSDAATVAATTTATMVAAYARARHDKLVAGGRQEPPRVGGDIPAVPPTPPSPLRTAAAEMWDAGIHDKEWIDRYVLLDQPPLVPVTLDPDLAAAVAPQPPAVPDPHVEPAQAQATAAPAKPSAKRVSKLDDPSTWKSAGEPVRPAQKTKLLGFGHLATEIDKLDKGHASVVIRAHVNEGDEVGHEAMDQALAAMERARLQPSTGARPAGPTPRVGPTRTV